MPLFSNRFTYKKSPIRRTKPLSSLQRELIQSYGHESRDQTIQLELNDQTLTFDTKLGQWMSSDGTKNADTNDKSGQQFETTVKSLSDENRILKLKVEILLQMLTEATAEIQILSKR